MAEKNPAWAATQTGERTFRPGSFREVHSMPKFPKPFFRTGRGWYVQFDGKQISLASGPKNPDTQRVALAHYHDLMSQRLTGIAG